MLLATLGLGPVPPLWLVVTALVFGPQAAFFGVAEGVICKGGTGGPDMWMVKIKTDAYLTRLKQAFADRWEDYWE